MIKNTEKITAIDLFLLCAVDIFPKNGYTIVRITAKLPSAQISCEGVRISNVEAEKYKTKERRMVR